MGTMALGSLGLTQISGRQFRSGPMLIPVPRQDTRKIPANEIKLNRLVNTRRVKILVLSPSHHDSHSARLDGFRRGP